MLHIILIIQYAQINIIYEFKNIDLYTDQMFNKLEHVLKFKSHIKVLGECHRNQKRNVQNITFYQVML